MKKLALRIDELTVESFPISSTDGGIGTVHGQGIPTPPYATCTCKLCFGTKPTNCPCTP